jgi:hypothetical protein
VPTLMGVKDCLDYCSGNLARHKKCEIPGSVPSCLLFGLFTGNLGLGQLHYRLQSALRVRAYLQCAMTLPQVVM